MHPVEALVQSHSHVTSITWETVAAFRLKLVSNWESLGSKPDDTGRQYSVDSTLIVLRLVFFEVPKLLKPRTYSRIGLIDSLPMETTITTSYYVIRLLVQVRLIL